MSGDIYATEHAEMGKALGVEFFLQNGLLHLELLPHQVSDLVEFFRGHIKMLVRKEDVESVHFVWIHRISRMCFEASTELKLTNLDRVDIDLLYEAPQEERFEWIFKIANGVRDRLRTTQCSIVVADHIAKSIEDVMTC